MAANSGETCYVDPKYYPHLLVLPALMIMIVLSFLKRRLSYRLDIWDGRPGLVIPMDFLGVDHDRLGITAIFGAATGAILQLVTTQSTSDNPWASAFSVIALSIEVAVLYYPMFACLTTSYKIFGALAGFLYGLIWFVVGTVSTFDKCQLKDASTVTYVIVFFIQVPIICCNLFILGKYLVVLYKKFKQSRPVAEDLFQQEGHHRDEFQFSKLWLEQYVKNVFKPRLFIPQTKIGYYLRKIYNPNKYFRFSTQTVSVVMICSILIYMFSIGFLGIFLNLDLTVANSTLQKVFRGFRISAIISTVFVAIFCYISILRFMECHKNNMLRMFKGDKTFIPKLFTKPQYMIGQSLKYACYQIGYLLWGFIMLFLIFFLIAFLGYSLVFADARRTFADILKYLSSFGVVALLSWITLPIISITVFRDRAFSKDVIALNNRNVYVVFSYFWFFVGLPMGFFSAIFRIIEAMILGILMLARIDCSVLPSGYEVLDQGHCAYLCFLQVQAVFRNPIVRVFCQKLHDTRRNNGQQISSSKRIRNKWFLLITLLNNPSLSSQRKHTLVQTMTVSSTDIFVKYGSIAESYQSFESS